SSGAFQCRDDCTCKRFGISRCKSCTVYSTVESCNLGHMTPAIVVNNSRQAVGHGVQKAQPDAARIDEQPALVGYPSYRSLIRSAAMPVDLPFYSHFPDNPLEPVPLRAITHDVQAHVSQAGIG